MFVIATVSSVGDCILNTFKAVIDSELLKVCAFVNAIVYSKGACTKYFAVVNKCWSS